MFASLCENLTEDVIKGILVMSNYSTLKDYVKVASNTLDNACWLARLKYLCVELCLDVEALPDDNYSLACIQLENPTIKRMLSSRLYIDEMLDKAIFDVLWSLDSSDVIRVRFS